MRRFLHWLKNVNAFRIGLAIGLAFAALHVWQIGARREVSILAKLENALLDVRFHQRGRVRHSDRVVIAAVDEASIARLGRFPWDRRVIASLVDKLHEQGALAVGFDMSFSDVDKGAQLAAIKCFPDRSDEDPDSVLGRSLERAGPAVVVGFIALTDADIRSFQESEQEEQLRLLDAVRIHTAEYRAALSSGIERADPVPRTWLEEYAGARAPVLPVARGARAFGFLNAAPDSDGVIRRAPLAIEVRGRILPSLDAVLVATALGVPTSRIVPLAADDGSTGRANVGSIDFGGKLTVPTDPRGLLRINYYGGDGTFTNLSVADVLEGKVSPAQVRGKIVLVGTTAQGTFDQRVTPFARITSGVETHANAIETMLARDFLRRDLVVQSVEALALVALALGLALLFARVRVGMTLPAVLLAGAAVWGASTAFFRAGYQVIVALPLLLTVSVFVVVTVYRYATEERDKKKLRKAFQLYLNPEVMEEMVRHPERLQLGGEERELSVLFSDIRGFTALSEKLSPQALVHLLNEYLSPMTEIVFEKRGTLDKYIGDALMAFFGAPVGNEHHALHCCDAALEMIERLSQLRSRWRTEDPGLPEIEIGIGINSGPMVVGNMGSAQRFNYTVMGDNVNLASRLEGLNKEYGTRVLVSESALLAARRSAGALGLCARELDSVRVKGRREPVRIFELRGRGPARAMDLPLLDAYARGLSLYRESRFAEARLEFESLVARFPDDGPARLLFARCQKMMARPPAGGWDGVFQMEHK